MPKTSPVFVYLISMGDLTKIGHSGDVRKRIKNLATSAPQRLEIAHTWRLANRPDAVALERTLHRHFKWARTAREWFALEPREIQSVGNSLVEGDVEAAERLADALRRERGLEVALAVEDKRLQTLNRRWKQKERAEASRQWEALLEEYEDAHREALDWGLIPSELDQWAAVKTGNLLP